MDTEQILEDVRKGKYGILTNNVSIDPKIQEELFKQQRLAEINARINPERYGSLNQQPRLIDVSGYYISPNVEGSFDTRGGSVIQEPMQAVSWSPYEDITSYGARLGANIPVNNGILSGGITGSGYNVDVNAPGFQGTFKDKAITGADLSYGNDTGEIGVDYFINENMPDDYFIRGILNF